MGGWEAEYEEEQRLQEGIMVGWRMMRRRGRRRTYRRNHDRGRGRWGRRSNGRGRRTRRNRKCDEEMNER